MNQCISMCQLGSPDGAQMYLDTSVRWVWRTHEDKRRGTWVPTPPASSGHCSCLTSTMSFLAAVSGTEPSPHRTAEGPSHLTRLPLRRPRLPDLHCKATCSLMSEIFQPGGPSPNLLLRPKHSLRTTSIPASSNNLSTTLSDESTIAALGGSGPSGASTMSPAAAHT